LLKFGHIEIETSSDSDWDNEEEELAENSWPVKQIFV
jgi:hypothetical protein